MSATSLPILITRAEPGASETQQRIEALGLQAVKTPVLTIQPRADEPLPGPQSLSGLVFTSANGVRAFVERSADRNLAAWCVGPATANAARDAGFGMVHESAGNAVDLADFIARRSAPAPAPLLHVANHAAKGDLKQTLEAHGFRVTFAPLYEMRVADALSGPAVQVLRAVEPAIVLIHSAKGGEAFVRLCEDVRLHSLIAVAISENAAQPLMALSLGETRIATQPNEDGLFDALASVIATLSA